MELLDRYVTEVGKRLPRRNRLDIENELRSTLHDMLEDRSRETGRPVDDQLVSETLREYGDPETVAATYQPENYLISPKAFLVFLHIMKMAVVIYTIVRLILLGVSLGFGATGIESLAATFGRFVLDYFNGLVVVFGWVVLVFAFLERFLPGNSLNLEGERKAWEPADLLKQPDPDKISPGEQVFSILFLAALLALFNFYPHLVRIVINPAAGSVITIPVLTAAFFRYLPWLSLIWLLELVLALVLLWRGRWSSLLRWVAVAISLLSIVLLAAMLVGPALVALTPDSLAAAGINPDTAHTLSQLARQLLRMGLAFGIIGELFSIIKHFYRLFAQPAPLRPPAS